MTTFYTSDTHFGHRKIIDFCHRPYSSLEEMNEKMIVEWNEQVSNEDTVYHTGDFFFMAKHLQVKEILWSLNGKIHLISGNHDEVIREHKPLQSRFESFTNYKEIRVDKPDWFENTDSAGGVKIVMFHFPIAFWNKMHFGSIHLHGHMHGNSVGIDGRIMDIGVDTNGMKLYTETEILQKMNNRTIKHHHV